MEKLNKFSGVIAIVAVLIAIFAWNSKSSSFGGTRFPQGLSADSTSPVAGEVRGTDLTITDDATISGGVLSVPTGAGATSTLTIGRIHMYATSSATQICIDFNTQATTTIAGTANGAVTWKYGSCN